MIPWIHSLPLPTLFYIFITTYYIAAVTAQSLTDAQIALANKRLAETAQASWELGTRAETILEQSGRYSVFSMKKLPPPSTPNASTLKHLAPLFRIADRVTKTYPPPAAQPLMPDGSQADPASIGIAVLIANLTRKARGGTGGRNYAAAARSQANFLLNVTLKSDDGAISHRVESVQIWSDSVYMIPPFLAYYGVVTRNIKIVREAYNQIKLYRKYLRSDQGMWKHISHGIDSGCWSTGNGWAAAGILRVYATIHNSRFNSSLSDELQDLSDWVQEIHDAMYHRLDKSNIFNNYADRPANNGNFRDAASTALLAGTVYRAAKILGQTGSLPHAERSRKALSTSTHFTAKGVLHPVVNPYNPGSRAEDGMISPEAQAFVVQMHQAWKDWKS